MAKGEDFHSVYLDLNAYPDVASLAETFTAKGITELDLAGIR